MLDIYIMFMFRLAWWIYIYCLCSGSPSPSVVWWKEGSIFDQSYEENKPDNFKEKKPFMF